MRIISKVVKCFEIFLFFFSKKTIFSLLFGFLTLFIIEIEDNLVSLH